MDIWERIEMELEEEEEIIDNAQMNGAGLISGFCFLEQMSVL